jgi:hypothetical protein
MTMTDETMDLYREALVICQAKKEENSSVSVEKVVIDVDTFLADLSAVEIGKHPSLCCCCTSLLLLHSAAVELHIVLLLCSLIHTQVLKKRRRL